MMTRELPLLLEGGEASLVLLGGVALLIVLGGLLLGGSPSVISRTTVRGLGGVLGLSELAGPPACDGRSSMEGDRGGPHSCPPTVISPPFV
jgi:hypothetical protein